MQINDIRGNEKKKKKSSNQKLTHNPLLLYPEALSAYMMHLVRGMYFRNLQNMAEAQAWICGFLW